MAIDQVDFLSASLHVELLDVVGCGIWIYDGVETRYVNRALCEITGYSKEDLVSPSFFGQLIHPDDRDLIVERGNARIRGEPIPETYEIRVIRRDQQERILALQAKLLVLASGPVSVVSAVDVTPLRQAERTLRDGTDNVVGFLQSLPAHVITTDPKGKPNFVNRSWLELTGQSEEEALSQGTAPLIHPADRLNATRRWQAALRSKQGYDIEYRILSREGTYRWQSFRIRPLLTSDGTLTGWTSASVDVDEARQLSTRLEEANARLKQAGDAKDEVLGLISHELRTPLTTLLGNARLLRRHRGRLTEDDLEAVVSDLEQDALRLDAVIANMLVLSRAEAFETYEREPLRLTTLAHSAVEEFETRHRGRQVRVHTDGDLPLGLGNATFYGQVLGNLLSNAHKYSPADRPIEVSIGAAGDCLVTTVRDHGPGIPSSDIEQVFEAFFRSETHRSVYGIGLGLTVCRRLVELQGGRICIANGDGGGCEFSFTIPSLPDTETLL